jgi:hypothetical protein
MKTKKIIEGMAKLIAERGMYKLEPMLIEALKEYYGVSGLHFWKDGAGWYYCSEQHPNKLGGLWGLQNSKIMSLEDLGRVLSGLRNKYTQIVFNGEQVIDIDVLKRFVLTKKLADIK